MKKEFVDYASRHERRVLHGKRGAIASGSTPYTELETRYLIENYGFISLKQIAKDLNRTYYSVVDKRKKLGLKYDSKHYSQDEDQYIRDKSTELTQAEVAQNLNRSRVSIAARAIRLGVRFIKVGDASPMTIHLQEDIEFIRELRELDLTYADIGDKFELHPAYVRQICTFERRLYDSTASYHQMLARQEDSVHGQT